MRCSSSIPEPTSSSVIIILAGRPEPQRYALIQDLPVADIICVFYVIDQSGHLLLWNRQLEGALEMSSEELPQVEVKRFFDEKDWPCIARAILDAFDTDGVDGHAAPAICGTV
ncbi:hypothetical protein [Massilia cavernae]|uniref:PAS domain-containing protein n=1 Tax=Massilia cavernae TaxID=2320864 RepID=A0A418XR87_9BURK|nr:hypothetical protein [Massilia cavernae]RJG14968.1 hypothetical protein D3872_15555 [Massilia cavernae]